MITKGMKIEAVKDIENIIRTGDVCEITDIGDDKTISFRFGGCHLGIMSNDEYKKYFRPYAVKSDDNKEKRRWSKWTESSLNYFTLDGSFRTCLIETRTNGVRVQVRTGNSGSYIKARSGCCPRDKFNFEKGKNLANKRLIMKLHQKELDELVSEM